MWSTDTTQEVSKSFISKYYGIISVAANPEAGSSFVRACKSMTIFVVKICHGEIWTFTACHVSIF